MSDKPDSPKPDDNALDPSQVEEVAGGSCTAQQIVDMTNVLIQAYENVVDFTSHVIERVAIK